MFWKVLFTSIWRCFPEYKLCVIKCLLHITLTEGVKNNVIEHGNMCVHDEWLLILYALQIQCVYSSSFLYHGITQRSEIIAAQLF